MATDDDVCRDAEELILEHLPDIVTLCNRMFRQRSDAEDATHEAVIAILRALPSYDGRGPVRHWALKVALNAARQHRRGMGRKSRRETVLPETGLPGAEMPNAVDDREEKESLRAAIAELPEDLRETVTLYYFHNLTQAEIAECVGCSQKTVHVRVKKGLDLLGRRLAGSPALAAMIAVGGTGHAVLDAVPPALAASVQHTVSGYLAATAATTTAAASAAATAGIATGGMVMNAKLLAGATLLAVTCLVGGAVLSNVVLASDADERHAAEIAGLRAQIEDGRRDVEALQANLESTARRSAARVADLDRELTDLREQVADKDAALAELLGAGDADPASSSERARTREERWAELKDAMAGVLRILEAMGQEGANQFELGPQMVAELGKLSTDDYEAILAFDAEETDPRRMEQVRAVVLQALIFLPKVAPHRDEYMARYLERVRGGRFREGVDAGALRSISFRMPPFVDAYAKLVGPMEQELRRQYVDVALDRAANGVSVQHRLDGVVFLGRTDDPRAVDQLTDVLRRPANDAALRAAAARSLAEHASPDVLRLLRDAEATEQDEQVLTVLRQVIARAERSVGEQR